jgi:hypothetical protein
MIEFVKAMMDGEWCKSLGVANRPSKLLASARIRDKKGNVTNKVKIFSIKRPKQNAIKRTKSL